MQVVDVLCDDRRNLAGAVQRGERAMTAPGFCRGKSWFHREAAPPCLVPRFLTRDKLVEGNRPIASPQSARRTEIRYPAFGRNAGAGERDDCGGRGDHVTEVFHSAAKVHCDHWTTIRLCWSPL